MDDRLGGGPYREPGIPGFHGQCPRCQAMLSHDAGYQWGCPRGCGTWVGLSDPRVRALDAFVPEPGSWLARLFPPGKCAQCGDLMAVRTERELTFDICARHGVWLDAGELPMFDDKCARGDWR